MAEEQAQHVSKGLECIKAIRDNPLCIEEIQEIKIIRDTVFNERESTVDSDQGEGDLDEDLDESQTATSGPARKGSVQSDPHGTRSMDGPHFKGSDGEGVGISTRSDIQHYYVHSHGGEEVTGIQDADSLMVPTDNNRGPDDDEGTDSADEGIDESSEDDPSKPTAHDRGFAPTPAATRSADVSTVMDDELTLLLGAHTKKKSREDPGRQLSFPKQPRIEPLEPRPESIKKGTGVKLISSGMAIDSTSINGATPSALGSPAKSSELSVPAANVPKSVPTAKMTLRSGPESGMHTQSEPAPVNEEEEEYEDELLAEILELKDAVTKINEDNQLILSKLDAVLSLKGEIDSIRKQLNKQNIAISTIEGHISSIMIAIPGFGKPDPDGLAESDVNPELRPIIGRDSGRALAEVLKKPPVTTGKTAQPSIKSGSKRQLLKEMRLQPINPRTSSAIKFNPGDDVPSKSVISSLIKSSSLDQSHKANMLTLLKEIKGDKNVKEFHQMVLEIIRA
ncbi:phosphoprotein [Porcine morbillivirus]|uniref:Phosphoprotein n=1 Tax=Porcine morbillivirus TaxID=2846955 RepID=A0A8F1NIU9_9MONO|nr:phosphoprotein [Porcine morbillivirus]